MAIALKQSTASQEILLGPFLDDTDGKTAETGLTIANTDIKIWVTGATTEASKNSGGATHIAAGRYYAVLDATDTATLGPMEINVHVSGALPVRRECVVLKANVYDSLIAGSDTLDVSPVTTGSPGPPTAAEIADAVWDEILSGHLSAGSTGEALDAAATAGGGGSPAPPTLEQIIEGLMGQDLSALTESAMPAKSLYGALAKLVHKVTSIAGTMTVYRSNGTTPHYTQTETEDAAANPLTGLGGAS